VKLVGLLREAALALGEGLPYLRYALHKYIQERQLTLKHISWFTPQERSPERRQ